MTPYTPIRSAFELLETPLRYCHDNIQSKSYVPTKRDCLMHAGAMVVNPIVLCAIPLTITADIVVGIAESAFCILYRKDSWRDVGEVAKKKIIISPLHQLTFLTINLGTAAVGIAAICIAVLGQMEKNGHLQPKLPLAVVLCGAIVPLIYYFSHPVVITEKGAQEIKNMPGPLRRIIHTKMAFIAANIGLIALVYFLHKPCIPEGFSSRTSIILLLSAISIPALYTYRLSQRLIGSFPESFSHRVFSIFRNSGAKDGSDRITDKGFAGVTLEDWDRKIEAEFQAYCRKTDEARKEYIRREMNSNSNTKRHWRTRAEQEPKAEEPRRNAQQERMQKEAPANPWKAFWKKFLRSAEMDPLFVHENILYNQFRDGILAGKSPSELLGLNENPSSNEVLLAFRRFSRAIHPDKNPTRTEESTALFQCLLEASSRLTPK